MTNAQIAAIIGGFRIFENGMWDGSTADAILEWLNENDKKEKE